MMSHRKSQGTRRWAFALVPSLFALAGAAQAQHHDRYYDDGYNSGPVRCESVKNRTQQCPMQGRARLVRQLSGSACVEGETWGQSRNGVWVTRGCRAEFIAEGGRPSHGGGHWNGGGHGGGGGHGRGEVITCDSNDRRERRCNVSIRRDARLIRQTSKTACVEGRTWGWDRNGVWVSGGCRGQFSVN